jgi:hypothetical protein
VIPSTVRANLKTALQTVSGLRVLDTIPDSANIPTQGALAVVGMLDMNFDFTLNRGFDSASLSVLLIVGRMSESAAQTRLDGYLQSSGATSIKAAIEADKTLGGSVQTLRVTQATSGTITVANIDYLSYRYEVTLIG